MRRPNARSLGKEIPGFCSFILLLGNIKYELHLQTLLLCQPHQHISIPAGQVRSCLIPTVIPRSTGSPSVEAAALYATSGSLMDVHGVLHDHGHLGLQLSIADALFKEL